MPDFSLLRHRSYHPFSDGPVVRSTPALPKLAFIPQQQRVLVWNAGVDLIISELADESKTGAAMLKLEIARHLMHEGDY